MPAKPDFIFAGEDHGPNFAQMMGAQYVATSSYRAADAVSGALVHADPMRHWRYLAPCVRPFYLKKVCVVGPASSGKSTLVQDLAARFDTVSAPDYARVVSQSRAPGVTRFEDVERFVRGQWASEAALARQANRLLFCDTDLLSTAVWSQMVHGRVPAGLEPLAHAQQWALTLLAGADTTRVKDDSRTPPDEAQRAHFESLCESALQRAGRPYVKLVGDWQQRFDTAVHAVEALVAPSTTSA